jgi:hypothetical protein
VCSLADKEKKNCQDKRSTEIAHDRCDFLIAWKVPLFVFSLKIVYCNNAAGGVRRRSGRLYKMIVASTHAMSNTLLAAAQ